MTPSEDQPILFDARLSPNRSLSRRGLILTAIAATVISALSAFYFVRLGALPALGFFGLDLALLFGAFYVARRDSTQETRVRVTPHAVLLNHRDARGREKSASLPTAFVRVENDADTVRNGAVRLCLSAQTYALGRFLTPPEREGLARALREAIARARTVRG